MVLLLPVIALHLRGVVRFPLISAHPAKHYAIVAIKDSFNLSITVPEVEVPRSFSYPLIFYLVNNFRETIMDSFQYFS